MVPMADAPTHAPPPPTPWAGLALTLLSLAAGAVGLIWLLVASLRGEGTLAPLALCCAALAAAYAGLWLLLRCATPPAHLRRLAFSLALLAMALYGLGAPGGIVLAGLFLLALGVLAHSGPIVFLAWVERCDARADGHGHGDAARSS